MNEAFSYFDQSPKLKWPDFGISNSEVKKLLIKTIFYEKVH